MKSALEAVREKAIRLWKSKGLMEECVTITAGPLSAEQAIGNPAGGDFPIQKGKEKLMEASFRGSRGQAFTEKYGCYSGPLSEIAALPMNDNFNRAVFVSTLNAVMRSLGMTEGTVHCRDSGPAECSECMAEHIRDRFGSSKVTMVGFQPAMAEALNQHTEMRLLDLDPDNVGRIKRGVLVEGPESAEDALNWAEALLVTGTTLANNSIDAFLADKPVVFYGTTIAGAADLMHWERFCPRSS